MPADKQEQAPPADAILINGELRPRNPVFLAIAEQAARNAASGLPDPYVFSPVSIEGEPLSQTIIRDRGHH